MKKKITYTDEPKDVDLDNARIMEDFLPSPEELVLKKDRIVTLRLDASTISDLKKIAAQKGLGVSSLVRMWVRERLNNLYENVCKCPIIFMFSCVCGRHAGIICA